MEHYDSEMAARVWQRVRGAAAPVPATDTPSTQPLREAASLQSLIAGELAAADLYDRLSRRREGGQSALLRRLSGEARGRADCLRGICLIVTGSRPAVHTPAPLREPMEAALRKAYTHALSALEEYESRTASREYGAVFAELARQQRAHCRFLLELLGGLSKNPV